MRSDKSAYDSDRQLSMSTLRVPGFVEQGGVHGGPPS